MNKHGNGIAYNIIAGLIMLIPSVVVLFDATTVFGGQKVFMQYALLVCGLVYLLTFVGNRRGYFRPGWILTQGFLQFFIGLYIFFLPVVDFEDETASITFGLWALVTAASQISGGIQLRALEVKRWWLLPVEGIVSLIWAFMLLINPFQSYDYLWLFAGMFMGTVSVCTVLEFMVHKI